MIEKERYDSIIVQRAVLGSISAPNEPEVEWYYNRKQGGKVIGNHHLKPILRTTTKGSPSKGMSMPRLSQVSFVENCINGDVTDAVVFLLVS